MDAKHLAARYLGTLSLPDVPAPLAKALREVLDLLEKELVDPKRIKVTVGKGLPSYGGSPIVAHVRITADSHRKGVLVLSQSENEGLYFGLLRGSQYRIYEGYRTPKRL